MRLLYVIIGVFLFGIGFNVLHQDWGNVLFCAIISLSLTGAVFLFKKQNQQHTEFLDWMLDSKADIYSGKCSIGEIPIVPNTRLIQYEASISFAFFHSDHTSSLHVKGSKSSIIYGTLYSAITFFYGWWSVPFGPLLTAVTLYNNFTGRKSMTVHDFIQFQGQPPQLKKIPKLMKAVIKGNTNKVSDLLFQGANQDEKDGMGRTPIMRAVEYADAEMVQILMDGGASLDERDNWGDNVLIRAAVNGKSDIVQILLERGMNSNVANDHGDTALMKASNRGYTNVMAVLIDRSANLNMQNQQGITALMLAVQGGDAEAVKMLLDAGASMTIKNMWEQTAWNMAVDHNVSEIIEIMMPYTDQTAV